MKVSYLTHRWRSLRDTRSITFCNQCFTTMHQPNCDEYAAQKLTCPKLDNIFV